MIRLQHFLNESQLYDIIKYASAALDRGLFRDFTTVFMGSEVPQFVKATFHGIPEKIWQRIIEPELRRIISDKRHHNDSDPYPKRVEISTYEKVHNDG